MCMVRQVGTPINRGTEPIDAVNCRNAAWQADAGTTRDDREMRSRRCSSRLDRLNPQRLRCFHLFPPILSAARVAEITSGSASAGACRCQFLNLGQWQRVPPGRVCARAAPLPALLRLQTALPKLEPTDLPPKMVGSRVRFLTLPV